MLEVREGSLGLAVHARHAMGPGRLLLECRGQRMPHRTRHTIQSDFDCHVDFPAPMRLLNHSCEPNCGVVLTRGTDTILLYTLREVEAGEELTIDYCTFENEIHYMTGPCLCGEPKCRGRITGFKDLTPENLARLDGYIAEYLQPVGAVSQAG
mgnify:CR=1 FL=1